MIQNRFLVSLVAAIIAIAMLVGVCSVILVNNDTVNVVAMGTKAGISALSSDDVVDPSYDSLVNGNDWSLSGKKRIITEAQWNGRIETKLHLGGIAYIYVNVDPRNVAWNDDIIIEYRSYYKSNTEVNQKVQKFYARITFYTEKGAVIVQECSKDMDSQAGFTRRSGKGSVYRITVDMKVTSLSGVVREATFIFG